MTRFTGSSLLALALAGLGASPALAQSTGAIDFENSDIIVTGAKTGKAVAGVITPDTSKAKAVLTQELISHQTPGQSINEIINLVPGVSFQNNDPYGGSGGKLFIRGFDQKRISETFDGIPLNDTGNYDLYSSQQLDPELIDQVNVNLGTTDVDSPTAAATGSTVNYRSITPTDDFGVRMQGSVGKFDYFRMFGLINTGEFTSSGTKAWFAASRQTNDVPYGGIGKIDKLQLNAKVYQPLGSNGDFVSIAGNWNRSRNNFFGSVPLRTDPRQISAAGIDLGPRNAGGSSSDRFPLSRDERFYDVGDCSVNGGTGGVADVANGCGSLFEYRYNPSDTGNIRINSKFTLSDKLTLTVDPYYQYVKANGGGTTVTSEALYAPTGTAGYVGSTPFAGIDLNGDGDLLDTVRLLTPSQTQTHRIGVIASLRYDLDPHNTVRLAYSYDRGRHRQTGEAGFLKGDGFGTDPFPADDPIVGAGGITIEKRDRLSYAILHQVSGEYRGEFGALTVNAGVRAPFFKRNLNTYCFTTGGGASVSCFDGDASAEAAYAAANPYIVAASGKVTGAALPQKRVYTYNKVLPTAGLTYDLTPQASLFANYSRGLQVPGTDNLYQAIYFPKDTSAGDPAPETTDNFDLGARFRSGKIQAQLSGWYTLYKNRLASSYDRDQNVSVYRNLGKVDKYGVDGSISYQPIREVSLYLFGSYLKSKIKDDVQSGTDSIGNPIFLATKGKRESGAPVYTFGSRVEGDLGPIQVGIQAKRFGPRYVNDQNLPVFQSYTPAGGSATLYQVFGAKAPAYTVVDLDARVSLEKLGLNDQTFLQLNVTNLFDKRYVGGFDGTFSNTAITFAQIGAPRTFVGTVVIGF